MESSEIGEPSCWTGVRIFDVVEVGQAEYLCESKPALDQPCSSSTRVTPRSPGKGKRKGSATPAPTATPKRLVEFDDKSFVLPKGTGVFFDDHNSDCASKGQEKTAVVLNLSFS